MLLTVLGAGALVAGCGPTPPQAPLPSAKLLDRSTGGISSACGESYQIRAFGSPDPREVQTLEASALMHVDELATVYRRNPQWMYQGETVTEIVRDAHSMLESCSLPQAAAGLRAATGPR